MTTKFEFTRNEIERLFVQVEASLARTTLPTEEGGRRSVPADEFMLMHVADGSVAGFKHKPTRNYVFLMLADRKIDGVNFAKNDLYVPMTNEPFMRGFFDGYDREEVQPVEPS